MCMSVILALWPQDREVGDVLVGWTKDACFSLGRHIYSGGICEPPIAEIA